MKHNPSHTEIVFKILYVSGTSETISTLLMEVIAHLVLVPLIKEHLVKSQNCDYLRLVVFFTRLLLRPSYLQVFSSVLSFQTLSIYFSFEMNVALKSVAPLCQQLPSGYLLFW
jgi:hypothetical protein